MKLSQAHLRFITASILATGFWIIFFYTRPLVFTFTLIGILIAIIVSEWKNFFKTDKPLFWILMPLYPILPFALLIYMNHSPQYHSLVYYIFLITFSFDASSYMAGMIIGNTKIIPSISPGKTVEGCIGGYIGALSLFLFDIWEEGLSISVPFAMGFVLLVCTIAFFGDMFESYLKRRAGIKDSGTALPGHGGFLDRFDAVIMVTFFFFIFRDTLITIFPG